MNSLNSSNMLPKFLHQDGSYVEDGSVIANCFADFFQSNYSVSQSQNKDVIYAHDLCLSNIDISIGEILLI